MSHPSRVRELKLTRDAQLTKEDLSHPSRVRELKPLALLPEALLDESHPSRVRELKLLPKYDTCVVAVVAPLPGA